MIGYITLGTNDIQRAATFYDSLLGMFGAKRTIEMESFIAWGDSPTATMLSVTQPYDKKTATIGNGVMVALACENKGKVDAVYKKAIKLGAKDEGPAGPRGDDFYAGYFRDLDGNKLSAYCVS